MSRLIFITHPEVTVEPDRPVTEWHLSPRGRDRMQGFAASPVVAGVTDLWSSAETKAREAARILADARGLVPRTDPDLGENDRSATGFLPPPEFERTADAFFAHPEVSIRGWERAIDAQARVRRALDRVLGTLPAGDVAILSHGAVGTLLHCALTGLPIDRRHDQPGQGHFWTARLPDLGLLHGWRPV